MYIVIENTKDELMKIKHIIDNNNKDGNFFHKQLPSYRETLCIESMIKRSMYRWDKFHYRTRRSPGSRMRYRRYDGDLDIYNFWPKSIPDNRTLTIVEHSSVWEFFKYIDYDYKNKKVSYVDEKLILFKESK